MEQDFWHQRWQEGRIGFHQDTVTPMLERHWNAICAPAGSRVFVPLCGKSLDMAWLAARGHRVLGVELSRLAVEQFFDEHALTPKITRSPHGEHHVAGGIELIAGDVFGLDREVLAGCDAFLDRAALIALPTELRRRYVSDVFQHLPAGCRGLLLTLEYLQCEMTGPPFAVAEHEVRMLYGVDWNVEVLERRDIRAEEPTLSANGLTALETIAYRMQHGGNLQERRHPRAFPRRVERARD